MRLINRASNIRARLKDCAISVCGRCGLYELSPLPQKAFLSAGKSVSWFRVEAAGILLGLGGVSLVGLLTYGGEHI